MVKIAPSILSADFGRLNEEIRSIEPYSDMLHLDIMDGHYVPNISMGVPVIKWIKTKLYKDTHLMITNPEKYIDMFAPHSDCITVHAEVEMPILKLIKMIKKHGIDAGVSLNPETDIDPVLPYLKDIERILIMSVNPGFGGQEFMPEVLEKVKMLVNARSVHRAKKLLISIDGGINERTGKLAKDAGVDILVAGNYIFKAEDRQKAICSLR